MIDFKPRVWAEKVVIPTYGVGAPDKNPMFLEKRVYQGSSGAVYPHPVIDSVSDVKKDREWQAVFLENQWLKIMILPELGGRVQMALDKTNDYHFVYYNRVIKPALVGLCGPWISGGIEFNWPQHHRPSTFQPVQWRIEEREDGSVACICNEIEKMTRTQGTHTFILRPGRAALEIDVRIYNRTDIPQTFLWWANPAVSVNDDYQSVFPPDVNAVFDHGKRAVSDFPIATGEYYKVDYSPGTDISRYKNIPVPTSFMAAHSDYDFIGCYDHGRRAGMLHVANHHLVPGKKQWTWGTSDFGKAWDRQLTDEDGPYIELMCGAFTDNQPDFSWLAPGEEKRFTQYFYPYKEIGPPVNACRDAALSLSLADGEATIGVYVSKPGRYCAEILAVGKSVFLSEFDGSPDRPWQGKCDLGDPVRDLIVKICDSGGKCILYHSIFSNAACGIPSAARSASPPAEIASNDELFLNGLHLEQYRHATYSPENYYLEALRRDPGDVRCNNAMGLLCYRRGKFAAAEGYFRGALERLTGRNSNPYDGEVHYNLGLSLGAQGRFSQAEELFWKAGWNEGCKSPANFQLARLACRRQDWDAALRFAAAAQWRNSGGSGAEHLQMIALLRSGNSAAPFDHLFDLDFSIRPYNQGMLYERHRAGLYPGFAAAIGSEPFPWIELALEYAAAGLFTEALELLHVCPSGDFMDSYFAGWIAAQAGDEDLASNRFAAAAAQRRDFAYPNRIECVPALQMAIARNPADALAPYALGNFWYAHKQFDDAVAMWELSASIDPQFPTVFRNLGLAHMNKRSDPVKALEMYERAFTLDSDDARVFYELDQLLKRTGVDPAERLSKLEKHAELCARRDDLTIERIGLLNMAGRHAEALELLLSRNFHPWEGGEGKTTGQYVATLLALALHGLAAGDPAASLSKIASARNYPANLGEGKLYGARENNLDYWAGRALAASGDASAAHAAWRRAAQGSSDPASAMYYNDQPPDMVFYQGLALSALGELNRADSVFNALIAYGQTHRDDGISIDYFAVSLPDFLVFDDDLNKRNRVHCLYMEALGCIGLMRFEAAESMLHSALELQADHFGAHMHLALLPRFRSGPLRLS